MLKFQQRCVYNYDNIKLSLFHIGCDAATKLEE